MTGSQDKFFKITARTRIRRPLTCTSGIIVDTPGGVNSTPVLCYTLGGQEAGKRGPNAG